MGWTWLLKLLCLRFTIFWKIGEYLISSRGLAPCFIEALSTGPVCSCMSSPCPGNEGPLERRPSDFFQLRFRDVMSCLSVTIKAATWKAKMGSELTSSWWKPWLCPSWGPGRFYFCFVSWLHMTSVSQGKCPKQRGKIGAANVCLRTPLGRAIQSNSSSSGNNCY